MSFFSARQVFDGLKSKFLNIPTSALGVTGIPSDTTVLYGDGWKPPVFVTPAAPAPDNSAESANQVGLTSGSSFSWMSGGGTSGAYGIVLLDCVNSVMDLGATVVVTYGDFEMTSKGAVYKNNNSAFGWQWVFELDGIPGGDQEIEVTLTQTGKVFTGWGSSYSYLNVADTGALQTAFGTGSPTLTVAVESANDIVWGAVDAGSHALTGFSLTTRQFSTGTINYSAGDTTGATSVTIGATASATAWSAVGLVLIAAVNPFASPLGSVEPVAVQSANYTASAGQMVPCDLSGGAFTVHLPPAPDDGENIVIKIIKQAATPNALTFLCGGSDVLNIAGGPASGTLILLNQGVRLQYDAAAALWYALSTDFPLSQSDARYVQKQTPTFVEYIGNASTTAGVTNAPVPAGIIGVELVSQIDPGTGGGSGALSAPGTIAGGGGAGAGGATGRGLFIPAEALGSTYSVSIPPAGLGGAAATVAGPGNAGTAPGYTSFTSGALTVQVRGATTGGGAGTNTAGGAGGIVTNSTGTTPGTAGGAGSSTAAAGAAGTASLAGGPSGGGGGGGVTAGGVASNGGPGGINPAFGVITPAAGGVVGGAAPGTGPAALACTPGAGAAGGAGATTGAAQAGANATGYGAGGSGGGGSTGTASGPGGNGGPGYLGMRWVYS